MTRTTRTRTLVGSIVTCTLDAKKKKDITLRALIDGIRLAEGLFTHTRTHALARTHAHTHALKADSFLLTHAHTHTHTEQR